MRWRTIPISPMGWIATLKMMVLPRINYLFSVIPTQPPIFRLKSLNTNISLDLELTNFCYYYIVNQAQPTSHGLTLSKLTVKTFKCLTCHSSACPTNTTTAWLWEGMGRGEFRIGDFGSWRVRGEGWLGLGIVPWKLWTGDTPHALGCRVLQVRRSLGVPFSAGRWAALLRWDVGHQIDIMPTGSYCCSLESIILRHADFQHELFRQCHILFPEVGEAISGKVVIAN